jgi:hypothetical protein
MESGTGRDATRSRRLVDGVQSRSSKRLGYHVRTHVRIVDRAGSGFRVMFACLRSSTPLADESRSTMSDSTRASVIFRRWSRVSSGRPGSTLKPQPTRPCRTRDPTVPVAYLRFHHGHPSPSQNRKCLISVQIERWNRIYNSSSRRR